MGCRRLSSKSPAKCPRAAGELESGPGAATDPKRPYTIDRCWRGDTLDHLSQIAGRTASEFRIIKSAVLLCVGCVITGFTQAPPLPTPPIKTKADAVITASSYIDKIACKFGTRKVDALERDTYFEISVSDVALGKLKRCDTEWILVCKADGALVKRRESAKCAVDDDATVLTESN